MIKMMMPSVIIGEATIDNDVCEELQLFLSFLGTKIHM